jgi:hypothetical protein
MSDDLISRSALKKVLSETKDIFVIACLSNVLEEIDNAPAVEIPNYAMGYQDGVIQVLKEVADGKHRQKGEWRQGWFHTNEIECSNCHWVVRKDLRSDFCPKCGADMRGTRE